MSNEKIIKAEAEAAFADGVLRGVYVVRYEERHGDEFSSGNFDYCHETEGKAREEMMADANGIADNTGGTVESGEDWAKVKCADGDEYNWYIDKLPIMGRD